MPHDTLIQLPLPIHGLTIEIPLTQNQTAIVDAIDADLAAVKWYAHKGKVDKTFYAIRNVRHRVRETSEKMHRVILSRMLGRPLDTGECTDHIDGDGLNNLRSNLRLASHDQNMRNIRKHSNNTSGYKGVSWRKARSKWAAQIGINGRSKYLGLFDTPEAAYEAYCEAAKELYGEFARFE